MVQLEQLKKYMDELKDVFEENSSYLSELDSAIGDADHGINMARGFKAVKEHLASTSLNSIGELFKAVSMQLIKTVGGASGPLYGTFFLKASMIAGNVKELDATTFLSVFEAGVEGIVARGKAQTGEKTMLDAWIPAIEAMKNETSSISTMLQAGAEAAYEGMKSTIPMLATKGRASYLGERSIGHQDPGATSTHLMFQTALKTLF